jgi:hypothetical protein
LVGGRIGKGLRPILAQNVRLSVKARCQSFAEAEVSAQTGDGQKGGNVPSVPELTQEHAHGTTARNSRIHRCARTGDFEASGSAQGRTAEKSFSRLPAGPPSFCCLVFRKLGNVPSVPGFCPTEASILARKQSGEVHYVESGVKQEWERFSLENGGALVFPPVAWWAHRDDNRQRGNQFLALLQDRAAIRANPSARISYHR